MSRIALACLLTVLIETPFLFLWGYRRAYDLAVIVCANVFTNLLLNLALNLILRAGLPFLPGWIAAGELAVVAAEYGIYARAFGPSRRLLLLTLAANALSFGLGLLLL